MEMGGWEWMSKAYDGCQFILKIEGDKGLQ
jgi:hypothetical protein